MFQYLIFFLVTFVGLCYLYNFFLNKQHVDFIFFGRKIRMRLSVLLFSVFFDALIFAIIVNVLFFM